MASIWMYILALCSPLIILVLSLSYRFIRWYLQLRRIQRAVDRFTVVDRHWLYGHPDLMAMDEKAMLKILEYTTLSTKGAFAFYTGILPVLVVCHSDTIKIILKTDEPKGLVAAAGTGYNTLMPWLGDGLLTSKGAKWFRNRRLLTPGFHFEILKPYIQIYNQCVDKLLTRFLESSKNNQSMEIMEPVSLCTLNVMRKCAFSEDGEENMMGSEETYVKAVNEMSALIIQRTMTPTHFFDSIYALSGKGKRFHKLCAYTHNIAENIIKKRRQQLNCEGKTKSSSKRYVDFLDILLLAKDEHGKGLTDIEIRDEVETFMFEGHDTTASAISWILYNLARHPQIQKEAQKEIDYLFQKKSCSEVEWEDLNKIPYVTRCIKESMRLHPPVPFLSRELSKDTELIDGHILPAGTVIGANIYTVHHNPRIWGEDHMAYNPDRFLPDNIVKMDSHAFIPFSAGPRNCIGQVFAMNEVKTTIVRILHQFNLSVDPARTIEMKPDLVLRAKYGIKLFFKERIK